MRNVLILGTIVLSLSTAHAAPVAVAANGGIKITLYDEPCRIPVVSNFPLRVTWEEGGKVFEGCFGGNFGVIAAYFENDRTVAIIPAQAFKPLTSA